MSDNVDAAPTPEPEDTCAPFPIVGAGASAGGLEALTQLLQELPVDTGMAFVIVQHLSPDRESGLARILSRATEMPVCEVRDEPVVEPNHVYVIPSGWEMFISGGKLQLLPFDRRIRQNGIDHFFRSLAAECGHQAIGVVLSGALSDGTLGIEAIKAAGGITFAQDHSARHDSMPRSAVASGCVDFVLPPVEIAREIARIVRRPYIASEKTGSLDESLEGPSHAKISEILHRKTGADFHHQPSEPKARREASRWDQRHEVERLLLTRYAPPGVLISPQMEVVHYRGDTGPYLTPAAGAPGVKLLKMLRDGLLMGVRAAILKAAKEGHTVRDETLRVKSNGGYRPLAVEVIPIKSAEAEEGGFLVLFEELKQPEGAEPRQVVIDSHGEVEIARLTQELISTRDYLQSVIERQDAINEELQLANEEAQSANEEMRSINEELETSKEEIQSSNEELATVNEELNNRNGELHGLNQSLRAARSYAEKIIASVRSPLVVLTPELRVKTANAAFYETFYTTPTMTEGRLIYELGNRQWNIPTLRVLLDELLPKKGSVDNFEVRHSFELIGPRIMSLNARHLAGDTIDPLIVLAIEDITERRLKEDSLAAQTSDLIEADRCKGEFLATLAHELRTPLAPLRNAAEILGTAGGDAAQQEQAHLILVRQIENMNRMLDNLLDVSRITEGKVESSQGSPVDSDLPIDR